MTVLGTKIREELKQWLPELCIDSDNIFVEIAAKKIHKYIKLGYNVCVTDLRFENELRMVREQKGIVIHIIREGVEKNEYPERKYGLR
jgi:hypothetical protein